MTYFDNSTATDQNLTSNASALIPNTKGTDEEGKDATQSNADTSQLFNSAMGSLIT